MGKYAIGTFIADKPRDEPLLSATPARDTVETLREWLVAHKDDNSHIRYESPGPRWMRWIHTRTHTRKHTKVESVLLGEVDRAVSGFHHRCCRAKSLEKWLGDC